MRTTKRLVGGGKVTIPKEIRDALDVEDGDIIQIEVQNIRE